jgi:hypothetical protein
MTRQKIIDTVERELERMQFPESFKQKWGRVLLEIQIKDGKIKLRTLERETEQEIK